MAYHSALEQIGLADREGSATLLVAKRVTDVATQGELNPERLTAATPVQVNSTIVWGRRTNERAARASVKVLARPPRW
jgi:hypothetical protein